MYIKETLDNKKQLVCHCDSQWFDSQTGRCADCQCEPDPEILEDLDS